MKTTVHLHIDRLVVEGLPEAQQRQFARSLEQQLRAWAVSGVTRNSRVRVQTLSAGILKPGATASEAASQVIHSLTHRLGGSAHSGPAKPGVGKAPRHV
jgi:hypothetical protein